MLSRNCAISQKVPRARFAVARWDSTITGGHIALKLSSVKWNCVSSDGCHMEYFAYRLFWAIWRSVKAEWWKNEPVQLVEQKSKKKIHTNEFPYIIAFYLMVKSPSSDSYLLSFFVKYACKTPGAVLLDFWQCMSTTWLRWAMPWHFCCNVKNPFTFTEYIYRHRYANIYPDKNDIIWEEIFDSLLLVREESRTSK